jgi:hypothetical protein
MPLQQLGTITSSKHLSIEQTPRATAIKTGVLQVGRHDWTIDNVTLTAFGHVFIS